MIRTSRYLPILLLAAVIAALWLNPAGDPHTKTLIDAAMLVGFAIACWAFGWLGEPAKLHSTGCGRLIRLHSPSDNARRPTIASLP